MATSNGGMGSRAKTVFVAQQLHFANALAGNDPKQRTRAMKKLRKYFQARSTGNFSFTEDDFLRIWKGLFYCMWMSDKPLIQEEISEEISNLVHVLPQIDKGLMFIKGFFSTIINEWYGIDFHRMDKFLMFVRRFLRQSLFYCKNKKWSKKVVVGLSEVFGRTILSVEENEKERFDVSLMMHFVDIFLEELSKVGAENLPQGVLLEFVRPFATNLSIQTDDRIQNVIRDKIFYELIKQSPQGIEYEEKFEAWKKAGFPGSSWKDMVFMGKEDNRYRALLKDLDPRAGGVNVFLPHINFDPTQVAELLRTYVGKSKKQALLKRIMEKFQKLANGEYPLAQHIPKSHIDKSKYKFTKTMFDDAAEDLVSFEEELEREYRKLERGSKRKKANQVNSKNSKKIKLDNIQSPKGKENLQNMVSEDNSWQAENFNNKETSGQKKASVDGLKKNKRRKKDKQCNTQEQTAWTVSEIDGTSPAVCKSEIQQTPGVNEKENVPAELCEESCDISFSDKSNEVVDGSQNCFKTNDVDAVNSIKSKSPSSERISTTPERRSARRSVNKPPVEKEEIKPDGLEDSQNEPRPSESQPLGNELEESDYEIGGTTLKRSTDHLSNKICEDKKEVSMSPDNRTPVSQKKRRQSLRGKINTRNITKALNGEGIADTPNAKETSIQIADSELEVPNDDSNKINSEAMTNAVSEVIEEAIPELMKLTEELTNQRTPPISPKLSPKRKRISLRMATPVSGKKVNIALQMNKSQAVSEYFAAVRQSPSVPHDANKKPCKGVLKRTSIQSPINPFYRLPKGFNKI